MTIDEIDLALVAKEARTICHGANVGPTYTDEEWSFARELDAYKRQYKRPFPTCKEVLAVLKSMGYRNCGNPLPRPNVVINRRRMPKKTK